MPSRADLFVPFRDNLTRLLHTANLSCNSVLVVACSGGVDSMVLLHLIHRYCATTGTECVVGHVNHGVRPAAREDEQLVEAAALKMGIPIVVHQLSQGTPLVPSGQGPEADLRRRRYEALLSQVKKYQSAALLVGHHADDQVETVLLRLVRGTSVTGLGGIRELRWQDDIPILRPLLSYSKETLETYARDNRIQFAVDETNFALDYTRNVLRHRVLPQLKELNSDLVQSVARFCEITQAEDLFMEREAQNAADVCGECDEETLTIRISELHRFPVPLQRRAIKILLYCLASADWAFQHVNDILQLTLAHSPSAYIHLPHGLVAHRVYDTVRVGPRHNEFPDIASSDASAVATVSTWTLESGGQQVFVSDGGVSWQFFCRKWSPTDGLRSSSQWSALFPFIDSLMLRTQSRGERIRPLGMTGHKKLQDVFVDAKVPKHLRHVWPVVCLGHEVVWIPGLIRSQQHLLSPGDETGWVITCEPPHWLGTGKD